ncbi:alpha/beta fold hydrolase [Rhodoferax sp.]|uniref:alpha/beta fold hydrolase n=1 Tax=Rhodoferax sp. TaxID=50421 RepID=UPI001ED78FD8|nr:alpha/beta fold hydrolase [Rhodoferax sp.]MBT9506211.1 alpha/beta fold hydrolase [Rhodoferax sp.]
MKIRANNIDIEVEDSGPGTPGPARPVVLLIMGLGMQLVAWPPQLVQALVDAGYRVIRHDNRDIGLSQHFDALGKPNILLAVLKQKLGFTPRAPYTLSDMAADSLGVLDALGIDKAHVVGVSMGGMIAQRVALAAPKRILSLTSVMSTSGARDLPKASPHVMRAMLRRPVNNSPQAVVDHYVKLFKVIGSPAFPVPEPEVRERILVGIKRSFHPVGTLRQMLAIASDISRAAQLTRLSLPTLVLHGKADPLVPYACGEDTARRIPGAKLVGIEGMGHDLPPGVVERLLEPLIPHLKAA